MVSEGEGDAEAGSGLSHSDSFKVSLRASAASITFGGGVLQAWLDRAFGLVLASLGIPQGNVNSWESVA
jgi:hypothetical protein